MIIKLKRGSDFMEKTRILIERNQVEKLEQIDESILFICLKKKMKEFSP